MARLTMLAPGGEPFKHLPEDGVARQRRLEDTVREPNVCVHSAADQLYGTHRTAHAIRVPHQPAAVPLRDYAPGHDVATADHRRPHPRHAVAVGGSRVVECGAETVSPRGRANFLDEAAPASLFDVRESQPDASQPIVAITSAGFRPGPDLDMQRVRDFGTGVLGVRASMTGIAGLASQQSFFFPGMLKHDGVTVTIWHSFAAMRDFAYGSGSHRRQLDRHKAAQLADRTSFTRRSIMQSTGLWYGWSPDASALQS